MIKINRKGKINMKKSLFLIAVLALTLSVSSCGKKDNKTTNQAQNQNAADISENYGTEGASENVDMKKIDGEELKEEKGDNKSSATLEESEISVEDAKLVELDGQRYVIISYKFTNQSSSAESFSSLMDATVFQDGSQLTKAIGNFKIEGLDVNAAAEKIEKGKTITVQEIYGVTSDAPITVTVKEFHSTANVSAVKTFNLK